jgi:AcrR family transcriptional regulator
VTTRGKAAVREALVEAAADLLAEEGDVSVRTIAAKAGVNHGLVHHYFDGKDGLLRAVLDHLVTGQAARLAEVALDDPIALFTAAMRIARDDRRFFRILARAMLDGDIPAPLQSAYPVVRKLVGALEREGVDEPKQRVAEGIALTFGWMLFEPWIRAATGLGVKASAHFLDDALARHTTALLTE